MQDEIQIPEKLGEAIDFLYVHRNMRLEAQKQVDDMYRLEKHIEATILERFSKNDLESAKGHVAQASVSRLEQPVAEDWDLVQKHILKTKDFDLLQKRLSSTACRERWKDDREIPGVSKFTQIGISLRKV